MCEHVAVEMLSQVDSCSYTLFSACFDHALTGSITVSFSVYSLTTLPQVVLQFVFQLGFDHRLYYSFFFVTLLFDYLCFHRLYSNICVMVQ